MLDRLNELISIYEEKGIVTRSELPTIDSRSGSRELYKLLKDRGYEEAIIKEIALDDYYDYSSVIYNSDRFTDEEVKEYMLQNVLEEPFNGK